MIDFQPTNHQLFNGKNTQYLLVEYHEVYGIVPSESSETIRLILPNIKNSFKNYVFNLVQFWIKTESEEYDVVLTDKIANLPENLDQPNYKLTRVNKFYNDTEINTYFDNEVRGVPVINMVVTNTDVNNILNIRVRVILEIFQQPVDGIGHYPLNT